MSWGDKSIPVPLEERLVRCGACGRPFLLAYRRPNVAQKLSTVVVGSMHVLCPSDKCGHLERVVVPVDGYDVTPREWLGTSSIADSTLSLDEALRGPSSGECGPQSTGGRER